MDRSFAMITAAPSTRACSIGLVCSVALASVLGGTTALGQSGPDTVEAHVSAARAAAGQDYTALFRLCAPPRPPRTEADPLEAVADPADGPDPPDWHALPVKVFDNLYFVGQRNVSAWAVTTSAGIILVDTIFDYSVEDEVVGGLQVLGLDPSKIKYAIVTHGHVDHFGGARYLQDHFGARVIMSAADWNRIDGSTAVKPKRDLVATDGQKLTLGDTTLTLYLTPGHTLGTISTLIPVTDHGTRHLAAQWGGTGFNWLQSRAIYITPTTPDSFWFDTYISSAERFRTIAADAGADVLISNHTNYDGSNIKLPTVSKRKPGDPHPYVVGTDGVQRYMTVAEECAKAGRLRLK